MKWLKLISAVCVMAVVLMPTSQAFALADQCNWHYNGTNQHACATQQAYTVNNSAWNAWIRSTMVREGYGPASGNPIGTIGWSYWAFGQRCNGVFITYYQPTPTVNPNSPANHWEDWGYASNQGCPSWPIWDKTGWTSGTHDFKQTGKTPWAPYLQNYVWLP